LFNRQEQEFEKFQEINKDHRQAHVNAVWANSIFFPVVELLSSLSVAFLLVWVALNVSGKSNGQIREMYNQIMVLRKL
jgi:ATP-binding cassette subfamily B protein